MRKIYLPTLKKIRIKNFTLYPNGLDFEHDFVNGVNLIVGGNGMGKTTLVNIIKYSIIGNYSKEYFQSRTYKERAIESRKQLPDDFYKSRMKTDMVVLEKAKVTIEFYINDKLFEVERCLEDIMIKSVKIDGVLLVGELIKQKKYENLEEEDKNIYLQKKFEEKIGEFSNIQFDDLIFFVNEILFFGEDHKTILWDDKKDNVQNELLNKYFNSPELNEKRQKAKNLAKYYDSLSRHKSEDMRAIKKVLKDIDKKKESNDNDIEKTDEDKLLEIKSNLKSIVRKTEAIHKDRLKAEDNLKLLNNSSNKLSIEENLIGKDVKKAENEIIIKKWERLHKNYDNFLHNLKVNKSCPMCNKDVEEKFVLNKIENSNNCILCDQEINEISQEELNSNFEELKKKENEIYLIIQNTIKEITREEKILEDLDLAFRELDSKKKKLESELRKIEFKISKKPEAETNDLQAFYDEISRLEKLVNENKEKSRLEKERERKFENNIQETVTKNTSKFSNLFSDFAGSFLGVECSLTYTDSGNGEKRFYPIIDGKIRYHEEQLSESQRFFVDHSFRMSILTFFYAKPTFYIVETPDSSLDISYERNAANVFVKFLQNPNALIITSNLNNSTFIDYLIGVTNTRVISLIEIGRKSLIQSNSNVLKTIYQKIKNRIKNEE